MIEIILEKTSQQDAIFFMTGIIGLVSSHLISSLYKKLVCRNKTTATVVHIIEVQSVNSRGRPCTKYFPVFSYDVNEEAITVQHNVTLLLTK